MNGTTDIEIRQMETCRRYACEFVRSPADSKVGLALNTLQKMPINGLRHPPQKGTNGWYIWCGEALDESPDFFSPVHVTHLFDKFPEVISLLGLPPGYRFLGTDGYQDVWFDADLLRV